MLQGDNFGLAMDYSDLGNQIGIGVRLDGEPVRRIAVRIPLDAGEEELARKFEELANRIRGLV
jgi:hypothetical protein